MQSLFGLSIHRARLTDTWIISLCQGMNYRPIFPCRVSFLSLSLLRSVHLLSHSKSGLMTNNASNAIMNEIQSLRLGFNYFKILFAQSHFMMQINITFFFLFSYNLLYFELRTNKKDCN